MMKFVVLLVDEHDISRFSMKVVSDFLILTSLHFQSVTKCVHKDSSTFLRLHILFIFNTFTCFYTFQYSFENIMKLDGIFKNYLAIIKL